MVEQKIAASEEKAKEIYEKPKAEIFNVHDVVNAGFGSQPDGFGGHTQGGAPS